MSARPSRRPRRSLAGIGLAAAVLLPGCVNPGQPDVGMKNFAADVVFGAAKPRTTPLPNAAPTDTVAPFQEGDLNEPNQDFTVNDLTKPRPAKKKFEPFCRTATVNDFPGEQAPDTVNQQRPTPGLYVWKRGGHYQQDTGNGHLQDLTIDGFEQRLIRNVTETAAPPGTNDFSFEYDAVEKVLGGDVTTTRWRVRPNAVNRAVFSPGASNVNVNAGQPDRGISIVSVDSRDARGNTATDSFNPSTPLLFLPLPIVPGNKWSSQAVDQRTLSSLQVDGAVIGHTDVDACGTLVDGWLVESTLTSSDGQKTVVTKYNYVFATQYGGILISEHYDKPATDTPPAVYDFTIGQVQPSPLP